MATSENALAFESQLAEMGVEITNPGPEATLERRYEPFIGRNSEPFETVRDALDRETRLRLRPPGPWEVREDTPRTRSWALPRLGHEVRLTTDGTLDDWTLTVDGDVELEDASRLEAFKAAKDRIEEIADTISEGKRQ
ncbi:hypothetical protein [Natrinema saccharevitans]|nr:hypothetical protein [Natrinema saccharevitans]